MRKFLLVFLLQIALAGLTVSMGQTAGKHLFDERPFAPGEKLVYEGKVRLSPLLPATSVADLTFVVGKAPGADDYVITGETSSKGSLVRLIGFSFTERYETTIDGSLFRALVSKHHDVQRERVRDSEATFYYKEDRVTYVETDPKDPMRPPRKIASDLDGASHDLLSALYSVRLMPLTVGESFEVKLSDSGLIYKVPVKVTARERQKSKLGKVWCLRLEPEIFGPGRIVEREGKMVIWVTDDKRKIPVRAFVDTALKLDIRLKEAANLK